MLDLFIGIFTDKNLSVHCEHPEKEETSWKHKEQEIYICKGVQFYEKIKKSSGI